MRVSAEVEREHLTQARIAEHQAATERLTALNAQLEATAEEKRKFVAMVIHDLRHPLTALQALFYLLEDEPDPQERAAYIEALRNRAGALANLLDALCEYNQIEAGQARLHVEEVELAAVIRACVENFAPAFVSDTVQLHCEIEDVLGYSQTDSAKLTHILLNLLSNALKFTSQGYVTVRARRLDTECWRLEVEDTGIGMNAQNQKRVFEEFYRGSETGMRDRSGSGLGLAIVQQLCQMLQATISLTSAPGKGTCFCLTFPLCLATSPVATQ